MRRPGSAAPGFLIIAILLLIGLAGAAPAAAFQEASPTAGTPAAPTPPPPAATETAAPAAATPAAAPAAPATTDVVTLVLWYANSPTADIIDLFPLATDAAFVASPAAGVGSVGTVDFPAEGLPTIVIGDTTFETYPRADGVVERWTWFDDFEVARPATLVMQLAGLNGKYEDYYGTGTLMSRDEGGAGGVLIVALRPPNPAAVAEQAAADEAAAAGTDQAAAEPAADAAAADVAPEEIAPEDQSALEPSQ